MRLKYFGVAPIPAQTLSLSLAMGLPSESRVNADTLLRTFGADLHIRYKALDNLRMVVNSVNERTNESRSRIVGAWMAISGPLVRPPNHPKFWLYLGCNYRRSWGVSGSFRSRKYFIPDSTSLPFPLKKTSLVFRKSLCSKSYFTLANFMNPAQIPDLVIDSNHVVIEIRDVVYKLSTAKR